MYQRFLGLTQSNPRLCGTFKTFEIIFREPQCTLMKIGLVRSIAAPPGLVCQYLPSTSRLIELSTALQ